MRNVLAPLASLLERADFLWLSSFAIEDKEPRVRLSYRLDGRRQTASAATLDELLALLAGNPPTKTCTRCQEEKPVEEFPRAQVRADRPEGRHSHCRECDRARKEKYNEKAKEARRLRRLGSEPSEALPSA